MNDKPKSSTYHAIINTNNTDGVHKRMSIEAKDLQEARFVLEDEFGSEAVVSLWGEWEANQSRNQN